MNTLSSTAQAIQQKRRLVVGLSGASGACLCVKLLQAMQHKADWETHLVASHAGIRVLHEETGLGLHDLRPLAHTMYDVENIGAALASGTFATEGMVVVPCSMKTLAGVCHGYAENLLLRAADVILKERRKLVLVARETPFSIVHLRNMTQLAEMGVVIMPPMLTFYNQPEYIDDMVGHMVGKILHEFGIEADGFRRWQGSC